MFYYTIVETIILMITACTYLYRCLSAAFSQSGACSLFDVSPRIVTGLQLIQTQTYLFFDFAIANGNIFLT